MISGDENLITANSCIQEVLNKITINIYVFGVYFPQCLCFLTSLEVRKVGT